MAVESERAGGAPGPMQAGGARRHGDKLLRVHPDDGGLPRPARARGGAAGARGGGPSRMDSLSPPIRPHRLIAARVSHSQARPVPGYVPAAVRGALAAAGVRVAEGGAVSLHSRSPVSFVVLGMPHLEQSGVARNDGALVQVHELFSHQVEGLDAVWCCAAVPPLYTRPFRDSMQLFGTSIAAAALPRTPGAARRPGGHRDDGDLLW